MSRCEIAKQFIVADFLPARGLGWNRKPIDDLRVGFNLEDNNPRFRNRFSDLVIGLRMDVRRHCHRKCLMMVRTQKRDGNGQRKNNRGCQRLRCLSSSSAPKRMGFGHRKDRFLALLAGGR